MAGIDIDTVDSASGFQREKYIFEGSDRIIRAALL